MTKRIETGYFIFSLDTRNKPGQLDLFRKHGFVSCRGEKDPSRAKHKENMIGKVTKHLDHILGITTPPIYELEDFSTETLDNIPSTQYFFGFNRKLELILDRMKLSTLRVRRMNRAIRPAAAQKKVSHIWAPRQELRTDHHVTKLRKLFESAANQGTKGNLKIAGMTELARLVINAPGY